MFEIYSKKGHSAMYGDWEQITLVNTITGKCIAHFWTYRDPAVIHEHDPLENGAAGKVWAKERPKEFRKSYSKQALDWAIELYVELELDKRVT